MSTLMTFDEATALRGQVGDLTRKLAECYRLTGDETQGYEDWFIAQMAVEAVHRLRDERDAYEAVVTEARVLFEKLKTQIGQLELVICQMQPDTERPS